MTYYKLWIDDECPNWQLAIARQYPDGSTVDIWAFDRGELFLGQTPVPYFVNVQGNVVDYNLTAFGSVVISDRLGSVLSSLVGNEIQRIPVQLEALGKWEVLNVLRKVDCIDHEKSIIQYYPKDFSDLAKAGKPRGVVKLRIRPDQAAGNDLFLLEDWRVAIIASEKIRRAIADNGFTGIDFQRVT